jgi:hypothetical protein
LQVLPADFLDRKKQEKFMIFMESKNIHLIADAKHPLLCRDQVSSEMILYNIAPDVALKIFAEYQRISKVSIEHATSLPTLSGGQKVLLMALLALYSPAEAIRFVDLDHSLDQPKATALKQLINESDKNIVFDEES